MAKSKEYWNKRFEALENAQMKKGAAYYAELEKQYNKAASAVQRDVEKWYARYAVNNEITLQEARKMLTSNELEEFRWNVMEYIEKGRTLNYSTQWAKQLENASARFHISRLEALKIQMQNHVEVLYGNELDEMSKVMERIYTDGYYHTAYEIQKGFNIGYSLMKLDTNKVEKVIAKPWAADGSNFSDRIWKQKSQLVSELHNNLTQAIIRGQNPSVVTDAIAKRFNVSKGQAGRLVMTESAFFASASNRDCYKDLDVEEYEILSTLDTKTSDICRDLDGKVFKMSEYEVGVTAPPFHTWCRTTTVPYFDDEFELGSERAARGDDGKTYHVPSNMKYDDWYKKYVENPSGSDTLTLEEEGALNKYLSFDSYLVNDVLRTQGYDSLSDVQKDIVDNLDAALKKMPTYEGNLSRSLEFANEDDLSNFISKMTVGQNIEFSEYISTTKGAELYNPNGQVQIFISNAKKGRNISSYNEAEDEVLYERNSKFKVLNHVIQDEKHFFLLEEL